MAEPDANPRESLGGFESLCENLVYIRLCNPCSNEAN